MDHDEQQIADDAMELADAIEQLLIDRQANTHAAILALSTLLGVVAVKYHVDMTDWQREQVIAGDPILFGGYVAEVVTLFVDQTAKEIAVKQAERN